MARMIRLTAAALLAMGLTGGAIAQTTSATGTDHGAHHPAAPAQAAPAPAPRGMMGQSGMMSGHAGMMGQGGMMHHHRTGEAAMQPFRRIEGRLAFFRAELRITEAQAPQWDNFADAVRAQAERLRGAMAAAMPSTPAPLSAPQQMERRIALATAHLEAMRAVSAAAGPLYAALTEEQRRTADELMVEHMRPMRMR